MEEKIKLKRIRRVRVTDGDDKDHSEFLICYIQPDGIGGAIPSDSNSTIGWISELFKRHDWSNSWNRMKGLKCREKHVFFWIGSNLPKELRLRVSFHPEEPPLLNPELPEWVTHLWIGAA